MEVGAEQGLAAQTGEVCVIFNTRAGRGRSAPGLERLRQALGPQATFRATENRGHARELAREAALAGYPVVGAAGGDGTVHEVANGLILSGRSDVALAVYPIGSANDYACALGLGPEWWESAHEDVLPRPVDVGRVHGPGCPGGHFLNNLGIGIPGAVAFEAENVPFKGSPRYVMGVLRALLLRFDHPHMVIRLDDRTLEGPTLGLSIGLGRREGNFTLAPQSLLDDGEFDFMHAGPVSRLGALRLVGPALRGEIPADHPDLCTGRCHRATVESASPMIAHMDGELLCRPGDDVRSLTVELLPHRLRVLRRPQVP